MPNISETSVSESACDELDQAAYALALLRWPGRNAVLVGIILLVIVPFHRVTAVLPAQRPLHHRYAQFCRSWRTRRRSASSTASSMPSSRTGGSLGSTRHRRLAVGDRRNGESRRRGQRWRSRRWRPRLSWTSNGPRPDPTRPPPPAPCPPLRVRCRGSPRCRSRPCIPEGWSAGSGCVDSHCRPLLPNRAESPGERRLRCALQRSTGRNERHATLADQRSMGGLPP